MNISTMQEIPSPRRSPIKSPKILNGAITIPATASKRSETALLIPRKSVLPRVACEFTHLKASRAIIMARARVMNKV